MFISLEGPEGAGKSTQARHLAAALRAEGRAVLETREPGGTPLGDRVREAVLYAEIEVAPVAEFLLYSASRAQLVRDVIRPALERGEVVICDRYADSSMAYQGHGRGLPLEFVEDVTWQATGGLRPHLTFLFDLDPRIGLERAARKGQPDRLERADLSFHARVREGFLELARAQPERIYVLDATRPEPEITAEILEVLRSSLRYLPAGRPE
nr:dTMP kinase [Deinobacterium chartae]